MSTSGVVRSRTIHHLSPYFQVVEAELDLDGTMSTWHYQNHPGAAIVVPVTATGSILVTQQFRVAVDAVVPEVPGGRIDTGETPREAAMREMFEEIGATADEVHFLATLLNSPGSSNETTHVFAARPARILEPRPGTEEMSARSLIAFARGGASTDATTLTAVLLALESGLVNSFTAEAR